MPKLQWNCIALWLILALLASGVQAAPIRPGAYRGTYHIDRWGQHRFGALFVSPDLAPKLTPFLGVPVSLHATGVDQPRNPGGAMMTAVGEIERLPTPVELKIQWQDVTPPRDETFRRIDEGEPIVLQVTLANRSGAPLPLGERPIYLSLSSHLPPDSSQHNSYTPHDHRGSRLYSISHLWGNIVEHDQTVNARELSARGAGSGIEDAPVLAPGASHTWSVRVEQAPPREYEISLAYSHYQRDERKFVSIRSNVLRLDVLTETPQPYQGLRIDLIPSNGQEHRDAGPWTWQVRFTNGGDRPLQFGLRKRGDVYDFSRGLLCYDRHGDRLLPPLPDGDISYERLRIAPGQSLAVPVTVPSGTALARLVFFHALVLREKDVAQDERPLGTGYILSPHVRVPEMQASRSSADAAGPDGGAQAKEQSANDAPEADLWAASNAYLRALRALHDGRPHAEVAAMLRDVAALPAPNSPSPKASWRLTTQAAIELAERLAQMAAEEGHPKAQAEAVEVADLPLDEQIAHHIDALRHVKARTISVPGTTLVLLGYGDAPDNAAFALRRIGKPAVPALIDLLGDFRPTRAIDTAKAGHALRYQDVALEILEAIAARPFDRRSRGRGEYLANASPEVQREIRRNVAQWWQDNQHKTEAEWIRDRLLDDDVVIWRWRQEAWPRLVELKGAEAASFITPLVEQAPTMSYLGGFSGQVIGPDGADAPAAPVPTQLVVQLFDPQGQPFAGESLTMQPMSIGYRPIMDRQSYRPDPDGVIRIDDIASGVRRFVINADAPRPTFLGFAIPAEGLTTRRQVMPREPDSPVPDLEVLVQRHDGPKGIRLEVTVRNNSDHPYTLTEADLALVSFEHRAFVGDSQLRPVKRHTVPPGGQGELALTLDWRRYRGDGVWTGRAGEAIDWAGPVKDENTGEIYFRVRVGNTYSSPIPLPMR